MEYFREMALILTENLCIFSKHVVSTEDIPDAVSVTPSSIDTLLQ